MSILMKRLNQLSAHLDPTHPPSKPIAALKHSRSISSQSISTLFDSDPARFLRPSASLIIIKPLESNTPDGFNYQTLLIQRNSSQRSFSSAYVFPGGNLDPDDHNHQSLVQKLTHQSHTNLEDNEVLQDSLKICAIRETFEEAGILVGLSREVNIPDSSVQNFRQKLIKQVTKFSNILQYIQLDTTHSEDLSKDFFCLDKIWHFANILTPTLFTKRWDTHFYLTILPSPVPSNSRDNPEDEALGEQTDTMNLATPDGSETISTVWLSPIEALKRCLGDPTTHNDFITVAPPQFYLLSDLSKRKDYRELIDFQRRMVVPFTPELVKFYDNHGVPKCALTLPGDPLHSSSDQFFREDIDRLPFKHRIYVRDEPKDFANHSGKFFRPLSVQRRGMQTFLGNGWPDLN